MSLTVQLLHTAADTLGSVGEVVLADSVLEKVNSLSAEAKSTLRNVGGALAVASFVVGAWRARGAIAGVLVGALGAIFFIWLLNNIDSDAVQNPVDEQISGAPAQVVPGTAPGGVPGVVAAAGWPGVT